MQALPSDVVCGSIFPLLSVRDLQALDTSFSNKVLRPHLRSLWTSYIYDGIDKEELECDDCLWLVDVGVSITSVALREGSGASRILSANLKKLCITNPLHRLLSI